MTRLPFPETYKILAADGPAYVLPNECSYPPCLSYAIERHHLVRRSFLGGPFDWVEYDSVLIQNVVGLCNEHHRMVTENQAEIRWSPLGHFDWFDCQTGESRKLSPHPRIGGVDNGPPVEENVVPDVCPTCHRPHRRKTVKPEEKRPRERWTIHVPKDERENGAEILDTLLEEARSLMARAGLPYGDEDNARYFILSAVLGLFVQHAQDVLS